MPSAICPCSSNFRTNAGISSSLILKSASRVLSPINSKNFRVSLIAVSILNLGVWKADNHQVVKAIHHALDTGYRLFDTAAIWFMPQTFCAY